MARCPECGGNMTSQMKRKICESCGLSLSGSEYDKEWDKIRSQRYAKNDEKKRKQSDYLEWYQSSKK